jgi:hypothetical protein
MKNNNISKNDFIYQSPVLSRPSCPVRPIQVDIFEQVKHQINFAHLVDETKSESFCKVIVFIIGEIYSLPNNAYVKIGKNHILAENVKSVYRQLAFEHIIFIAKNLNNCQTQIKQIKQKRDYLQTALYNAVIEYELDDLFFRNEVLDDIGSKRYAFYPED